jgi:hypothetical protein
MWTGIITAAVLVPLVAAGIAHWSYRQASADAAAAAASIRDRARPAAGLFDPTMVADLPEIAQRYFRHAIAPGTPLYTTVELGMAGMFLLGDKGSQQSYAMTARQVLAPPGAFVWMPRMQSAAMVISGSDALVDGVGWTRFWIAGLVPVVNSQTSPDLVRSALARPAVESIWAPASLLPDNGVAWEQSGPDTARLTFATGIEPVELTLDAEGRVLEVVIMRWSNANAEGAFRLQPFGGTINGEATFGGFTIPSMVEVGNHFGTPDYLPFFRAQITSANYL